MQGISLLRGKPPSDDTTSKGQQLIWHSSCKTEGLANTSGSMAAVSRGGFVTRSLWLQLFVSGRLPEPLTSFVSLDFCILLSYYCCDHKSRSRARMA
jgi:hypothetical protein